MILKYAAPFVLLTSIFLSGPAKAQDDRIPLLLDRSPAKANAIGYINIESLNKLMRDAGFAENVSKNVEDFWFISDLDLMKLQPRWEAGYATLKQPISAKELAEKEGGYVDQIGMKDVVWTPKETYLFPAKENRLGVLRPANRSLMAGWITPDVTVNYSRFLESKASQKESYLSLMLAIEVEDVFSPTPLTKRLESYESLKANPPQSVASTLASAVGFSIIVGRNSLNECILSVDFKKSPAGLKQIAPQLLAEILERGGTAAPEVLTWRVKVEGNTLAMQGPITEATLGGLLGIFSLQGQADRIAGGGRRLADGEKDQMAYRSKAYFTEVNEIVELTRKHKSKTTGALAKWNDQRARKIDELGTLNVDPEMIQYGTNVAESLRGNALTVRSGNIQAGKVKASQSLSSGYGNGYYGNGYYNANSTTDYQAVTSAYARGNAYADFKSVLNQIDKLTAEVRRSMTAKYNIQF